MTGIEEVLTAKAKKSNKFSRENPLFSFLFCLLRLRGGILFASGFNTQEPAFRRGSLWGGFNPDKIVVCVGIKPAYNPYFAEPTIPRPLCGGVG
jgi:hypothetical protein